LSPMKTIRLTLGVLLASASVTVTLPAQADPEQPPPAELRERVEQLGEKARDLKAAGRHEEALRVMREADELEVQAAARRENPENEGRRLEGWAREEAARAERGMIENAERRERLAQLDREADRPERPRMERPRPERPEAPRPVPPDREGIERRMHHFELALENLHAAGLHDLAERLGRERERVVQQLRVEPERNPAVQEEIERLRAELNELRRAVQGLKGRVEELHRDEPRR